MKKTGAAPRGRTGFLHIEPYQHTQPCILVVMFLAAIIQDYFLWHYTTAWWQLWGVWRNYLWFVIHFFSLPQLLRSWIAPFKRMTESRGNRFSGEDLAAYIIVNLLSRVLGALIRTVVIITGLLALAATVAVGFAVYLVWALLPLGIIGLIGASISMFLIRV